MQQRRSQPSPRDRATSRVASRRSVQTSRPNRDRYYLAATVAILALSLVAFAALVIAGADTIGGDGGGPARAGAIDQPPPPTTTPTATVLSVIPTPGPTDAPTAPATAVTTPVAPAPQSDAGDRPIVCIDVGHGGVDEGKLLLSEDGTEILEMEKDFTLAQALELRERLEARGIEVVLTRETDTEVNSPPTDVNGDGKYTEDLDGDGVIEPNIDDIDELDELQARVNVCNEAGADLMISIHINGAANLDLKGYEAWYAEDDALRYVEESALVANLIVQNLGEQFAAAGYETVNRGAAPDSMLYRPDADQGTFDHLVMLSPDLPARNYVGLTMPAVIVECLFLSNEDDAAFLTETPEVAQNAIVTAYEESIVAYFAAQEEEDAETTEDRESDAEATVAASATATREPDEEEEDAAAGPTPTARPEPLPDNGETAQVHYYSDSGRPEIALTFDLGSDRGHTEQILDYLEEAGITASFGVTGLWAEQNPDLLQRIVDDGHMLFNHTYSHRSFTGDSTGTAPLTREERIEEIERTEEIVREMTGYDMRPYFRLPYGDGADDPEVLDDIYAAGYYLVIMWTCDSYGWKQWTPAEIIQHCYATTGTGGIVLMHVGSDGTDQDALPGLVDAFKEDGYDFVSIEDLLAP